MGDARNRHDQRPQRPWSAEEAARRQANSPAAALARPAVTASDLRTACAFKRSKERPVKPANQREASKAAALAASRREKRIAHEKRVDAEKNRAATLAHRNRPRRRGTHPGNWER